MLRDVSLISLLHGFLSVHHLLPDPLSEVGHGHRTVGNNPRILRCGAHLEESFLRAQKAQFRPGFNVLRKARHDHAGSAPPLAQAPHRSGRQANLQCSPGHQRL